MTEDEKTAQENPPLDRATLIRDMALLQVKLIVDGFRDFLLVPVSLVAGLLSLLKAGERPGLQFYELLHLGRRTERVINLFGAADRIRTEEAGAAEVTDIDDMMRRVEGFVIDEYHKGGVPAQAKDRLDQFLSNLRKRMRDREATKETESP